MTWWSALGSVARASSLGLLVGCAHSVNLRVLDPADITLPADVKRIAVLDRHRPRNTGQAVLDVLEGIVTGEAVNMDREGARVAVSGVVERLAEGPRFDPAVPLIDRDQFPSDIFDRPLTQDQVRQICRQTGTDALLALDAFDSDLVVSMGTHTEVTTDSHGREIATLIHDAVLESSVVASWRLYHPKEGVLDEVRDWRRTNSWTASGRTPGAAQAGLIGAYDATAWVGRMSGRDYGARISPTWVWLERVYYGRGDPRLKEARHHVRANDWDGAEAIWTGLSEDPDPKVRGRALFNLALAHEVDGELYPARRTAKEAAVALHNGRARTYVRQLERRVEDRKVLKEQMAEEPEPAPAPRPPAPPSPDAPLAVPAPTPAPPTPQPAPAPTRLERPR